MLPDRSGFDVCRMLKADAAMRTIPVLMLTARSSEDDRIHGFESGAEDYVLKPFSPRELVLRVKAMLGRTKKAPPDVVQAGPFLLYPHDHRLLIADEEVQLTLIEFKILLTLARHPNVARTREQLLAEIWEEDSGEVLDRAVDAHIKRLRAKLGAERNRIETLRGIGYRLTTHE
jgi:DNA-binding response OmpR family regulator